MMVSSERMGGASSLDASLEAATQRLRERAAVSRGEREEEEALWMRTSGEATERLQRRAETLQARPKFYKRFEQQHRRQHQQHHVVVVRKQQQAFSAVEEEEDGDELQLKYEADLRLIAARREAAWQHIAESAERQALASEALQQGYPWWVQQGSEAKLSGLAGEEEWRLQAAERLAKAAHNGQEETRDGLAALAAAIASEKRIRSGYIFNVEEQRRGVAVRKLHRWLRPRAGRLAKQRRRQNHEDEKYGPSGIGAAVQLQRMFRRLQRNRGLHPLSRLRPQRLSFERQQEDISGMTLPSRPQQREVIEALLCRSLGNLKKKNSFKFFSRANTPVRSRRKSSSKMSAALESRAVVRLQRAFKRKIPLKKATTTLQSRVRGRSARLVHPTLLNQRRRQEAAALLADAGELILAEEQGDRDPTQATPSRDANSEDLQTPNEHEDEDDDATAATAAVEDEGASADEGGADKPQELQVEEEQQQGKLEEEEEEEGELRPDLNHELSFLMAGGKVDERKKRVTSSKILPLAAPDESDEHGSPGPRSPHSAVFPEPSPSPGSTSTVTATTKKKRRQNKCLIM